MCSPTQNKPNCKCQTSPSCGGGGYLDPSCTFAKPPPPAIFSTSTTTSTRSVLKLKLKLKLKLGQFENVKKTFQHVYKLHRGEPSGTPETHQRHKSSLPPLRPPRPPFPSRFSLPCLPLTLPRNARRRSTWAPPAPPPASQANHSHAAVLTSGDLPLLLRTRVLHALSRTLTGHGLQALCSM